jgi:hypothetical protein
MASQGRAGRETGAEGRVGMQWTSQEKSYEGVTARSAGKGPLASDR